LIQPDPHKLFAAGLSFEELASVIRENVENAGGGVLNHTGKQVTVRTLGRVQSLHEIAGLPVKFGAGAQPILVKDVAEVAIGSAFRTGAATANGREAIVAYLLMMTGENSRLVAQRAHEKLADIQSKLPPGVVLQKLYNRSDLVNRTITTVRNNLLEGAVLVIAVLFALLGNWRAAFIVASAIPLSMLSAITGMVRFGVSGNLMSLGAVDFGLIVDGAVVIAENAVRLVGLRQRALGRALSPIERRETILESCRQVGKPMVFGVVIITIVYVPILALAGTAGKMFHPMAITVMLALIGSLLLALTLIPALCAWFLGGVAAGVPPAVEPGVPPGGKGVDDLRTVGVGGAEPRGGTPPSTAGETPATTADRHDIEDTWLMRGFNRVYGPVLLWGLRHRLILVLITLLVLGGAVFLFQRLRAEFVPQLDEGSLVLQIVGPTSVNLETSVATQLRAERIILEEFPEIAAVFSRIGTPEIGTDPMGANLSDTFLSLAPPERWRKENGRTLSKDELIERITATLQAKVPGQQYLFTQPIEMRFNAVGLFVEGNRRHEIVVRMSEAQRGRLEDLKLLPVRVQETGLLPLGKVSRVTVRDQVNMIEREGGRRRAGVEVNLRGRDIQSWVNEAKEKLGAISMPQDYYVEFGGQFEQLLEARSRLAFIAPLALLLIFMLILLDVPDAGAAARAIRVDGRSGKFQVPSSKIQVPKKHQASSTNIHEQLPQIRSVDWHDLRRVAQRCFR
jgi:cobalt-zinc-cadmium resistance protein CzcA